MKNLIFIAAVLTITNTSLFAQGDTSDAGGGGSMVTTYTSGLQKAYGGALDDGGNFNAVYYSDLKVVPGGYIFGGMSSSVAGGTKSVSTNGSFDYYVVKTNSSGTIIWDKTYGGTESDELGQIFPTSDGGYLLAGSSKSGVSGNKTTAGFGDYDAWIVKIDALGAIVWQKSYGGSLAENTTKNIFEVNGRYYVGVSSRSGATGNKSFASYGNLDYVIIGLNTQTGNIEFEKAYGGNADDDLHSIYVKSNGTFVLFGCSKSDDNGVKTTDALGDWDYWIVSCAADGTILWQKTFGGSGYDFVTDARAIKRSNGAINFVVGGYSNSPLSEAGDRDDYTHGKFDMWVVYLQENGTKIQDKTYGGAEDDLLESIDVQTNAPTSMLQPVFDEVVIFSGYSNSDAYSAFSGYKTQNNFGPSDGWVVLATAATGLQFKDFALGGSGDDAAVTTKPVLIDAFKKDYDYVTLSFTASGISGNKTVASLGNYDMWLHVMQKRTYYGGGSGSRIGAGGNEPGNEESGVSGEISKSVYPTLLKNGEEISVLFDVTGVADGKTVDVVIYSMDGKVIFKETLLYGQKQVIRPEFPAEGIYVLSIMSGDNKLLCSKKIVVNQ